MGSLFAAALLAGGVNCASAQSIDVLENMTGGDGVEYQPVVQAISPNHRYVAGPAFSMASGSMGMSYMTLRRASMRWLRPTTRCTVQTYVP